MQLIFETFDRSSPIILVNIIVKATTSVGWKISIHFKRWLWRTSSFIERNEIFLSPPEDLIYCVLYGKSVQPTSSETLQRSPPQETQKSLPGKSAWIWHWKKPFFQLTNENPEKSMRTNQNILIMKSWNTLSSKENEACLYYYALVLSKWLGKISTVHCEKHRIYIRDARVF